MTSKSTGSAALVVALLAASQLAGMPSLARDQDDGHSSGRSADHDHDPGHRGAVT